MKEPLNKGGDILNGISGIEGIFFLRQLAFSVGHVCD